MINQSNIREFKKPRDNEEDTLHTQTCNYLHTFYPEAVFTTDLSGLRVSKYVAKKIKNWKSENGIPDLLIFKPINGWHGLLIELKKEGQIIIRPKGTYFNKHIGIQAEVLEKLTELGYYSTFAIGLDGAIQVIDRYMKGEVGIFEGNYFTDVSKYQKYKEVLKKFMELVGSHGISKIDLMIEKLEGEKVIDND